MIMPGKKIIFSKNLELACFHWNGKGLRPSTLQLSCDHPTPASPTLYPLTPVKTHKSLLVLFSNATWGYLGCQPYDWGGGKKRAQLLKPRVPRCNFIESQITMNGFNCTAIVAVNPQLHGICLLRVRKQFTTTDRSSEPERSQSDQLKTKSQKLVIWNHLRPLSKLPIGAEKAWLNQLVHVHVCACADRITELLVLERPAGPTNKNVLLR